MIKFRNNDVNRVMFRGKEISIPCIREGLISLLDFKGCNIPLERYKQTDLISGETVSIPKDVSDESIDCISFNKSGITTYNNADVFRTLKSKTDVTLEYNLTLNKIPDYPETFMGFRLIDSSDRIAMTIGSGKLAGGYHRITATIHKTLNEYSTAELKLPDSFMEDMLGSHNTINITIQQTDNQTIVSLYRNGIFVVSASLNKNFDYCEHPIAEKIHISSVGNWKEVTNLYSVKIYNRRLSCEEMKINHRLFEKRFNKKYVQKGLRLDIRAEDVPYIQGNKRFIKDNSIYKNDLYHNTSVTNIKHSPIDKYIQFDDTKHAGAASAGTYSNHERIIVPKESFSAEICFSTSYIGEGHRCLMGYERVTSSERRVGEGFMIGIQAGGHIRVNLLNNTSEGSHNIYKINQGEVLCVSATYNHINKQLTCYINGEQVYTMNDVEYVPSYDTKFFLGGARSSWYNAFSTHIHSCRLYDRVLEPLEVAKNYQQDRKTYIEDNIPTSSLVCDLDGRIPPINTDNQSLFYWPDASANNLNCECKNDQQDIAKWYPGERAYELYGFSNGKCNINNMNGDNSSWTICLLSKYIPDIQTEFNGLFSVNGNHDNGYIAYNSTTTDIPFFNMIDCGYLYGLDTGRINNHKVNYTNYNHITLVVDFEANKKKLYINGEFISEASFDLGSTVNRVNFFTHGINHGSEKDHSKQRKTTFYNRALTDEEIKQHFDFCKKTFVYEYCATESLICNIDCHDKPTISDTGYIITDRVNGIEATYTNISNDNIYNGEEFCINTYKTNGAISVPCLLNSNQTQFTLSMRCKLTESESICCIVHKNKTAQNEGRLLIYSQGGRKIYVDIYNPEDRVYSEFNNPQNEFFNIDLVYNKGKIWFYGNGQFIKSWDAPYVSYSNTTVDLLSSTDNNNYRNNACLQSFRLYDRALKSNEIENNYHVDVERFNGELDTTGFIYEHEDNVYYSDDKDVINMNGNYDIDVIVIPDDANIREIVLNNCTRLRTIRRQSETHTGIDLSGFKLDKLIINECRNITHISNIYLNNYIIPDNFLYGVGLFSTRELFDKEYIKTIRYIGDNFMNSCNNLIDVNFLFKNTNLKLVGRNMFNQCKNLESAISLFENSKLEAIPEDIFVATSIKMLHSLFKNCTQLSTGLDNEFLRYESSLIDISQMFYNCHNITGYHIDFYKYAYVDMSHPGLKNMEQCYYGCTGLLDYENINSNMK